MMRHIMRSILYAVLLALAVTTLSLGRQTLWAAPDLITTPTPSDASIKVGVVVGYQGNLKTFCITLPPSKATGLDALEATGLDLNAQRGALGATVCRIDGIGCAAPSQDCFCECQGTTCRYWSYYKQDDTGKWLYSQSGVSTRPLSTGAMEGWFWMEDTTNQTAVANLPALTLADVCELNDKTGSLIADSPSGATSGNAEQQVVGFVIFGVMLIIIGGLALWRRRQSI